MFGVDLGRNKVEIIGVHHIWENAVLRARHGIHRILVRRHGRGEQGIIISRGVGTIESLRGLRIMVGNGR